MLSCTKLWQRRMHWPNMHVSPMHDNVVSPAYESVWKDFVRLAMFIACAATTAAFEQPQWQPEGGCHDGNSATSNQP